MIKTTEIYRVSVELPKGTNVHDFNDLVWERATVAVDDIEWHTHKMITTVTVFPSDNVTLETAQELEKTMLDIVKQFQ